MAHVPANLGDLVPNDSSDEVALVSAASGRRLRWQEYRSRVDAFARGFLRHGLRRGDRVGLLGLNGLNYVCAYLGLMKAGLVAVPINHRVPAGTVAHIVADAGLCLVLVDDAFRDLVPASVATLPLEDGSEVLEAILDHGSFAPAAAADDEIAMILYTSGSTGRPKGVPLSHRGQLWVIEGRVRVTDYPAHRMLVAAPLCHMNALLVVKLAALGGGSVVLMPEFAAETYIAAIGRWRPTWLTSVPTMLALVARRRDLLAATDLSSVRIVAMGSAPVTQGLFDRLRELFPGASVMTNYGTTESGAGVFGAHPAGLSRPPMSIGYPLTEIGFRLIDAKGHEASAQGRLQLRTPAVMSGYLNLPEKTAEVLSADGWYDTGDILRRDADGFCFFVGRSDDMFVCGGENVVPGEVETLLERHPAVQQACVVAVPDDIKGMKPVAFVVPRDGYAPDPEALKAFTLREAPAYMHPRRVWFLDRFPLGPTGKIDRKTLAARAAADGREIAA